MVIDLSEVISAPGGRGTFTVDIGMDVFEMNGVRYAFARKHPLTLTVANEGSREVTIDGVIDVTLHIPCDRCLEDVPVRFDIPVHRTVDFRLTDEERLRDLDETAYIDHDKLDVDQLVFNEIFVHFPMKTLCREDCRGLCPKCGQNLNLGACGCDRTSLDPRMSSILDIFNQSKEV